MKNVVITGAGGNLGKIVASHFLEKGFNVVATVLNAAEAADLRTTVEGAASQGERTAANSAGPAPAGNLRVEELNLTDEAAVQAFADRIIEEHRVIDAALMLAGGFAMGGIRETGMQAIKKQLTINFETAYTISRHFFLHMMERGAGRLVFVGTRPALKPEAGKGMIAYALSKSLLFRLAEMLNEEAGETDVVSSVIVPSTIDTPDNRKNMPGAAFDKWVKPEQIAELLHLICSGAGTPLRETVLKIYNKA